MVSNQPITTTVKQMCGIGDLDRAGTHKEAAPKRIERDENDIQKMFCVRSDERSLF